jgi:hypothetical protein
MLCARKEVIIVPPELAAAPTEMPRTTPPEDELLREWARKHVERVHRLKRDAVVFVVVMAVLTPLWALIEWQDNGGFERWSSNGSPGDWEPWILYVALVWLLILGVQALRTRFDRPATDAEVERELRRLHDAG